MSNSPAPTSTISYAEGASLVNSVNQQSKAITNDSILFGARRSRKLGRSMWGKR